MRRKSADDREHIGAPIGETPVTGAPMVATGRVRAARLDRLDRTVTEGRDVDQKMAHRNHVRLIVLTGYDMCDCCFIE